MPQARRLIGRYRDWLDWFLTGNFRFGRFMEEVESLRAAWYSTLRMVYHTSRMCYEARNIPDAYRREGKGGRVLCNTCLILQAKGRALAHPQI